MKKVILVAILFLCLYFIVTAKSCSSEKPAPLPQESSYDQIFKSIFDLRFQQLSPESLESRRKTLIDELYRRGDISALYLPFVLLGQPTQGMNIGEVRAIYGQQNRTVIYKWGLRSPMDAELHFCLNEKCDEIMVTFFKNGDLLLFEKAQLYR